MPRKAASSPERGLRHLALKTRSLALSKRFYVDGLGLEVAFTHRGMLFLKTPGGEDLLNFMATREPFDPEAGGFDHFGLRVPAPEWISLMARLKRKGIAIAGRRGLCAVYLTDPNGYTVELYRD
ncbi:MAG: VOC family protein [Proteobacteria bacterium]|nr:VOC family protein [Pseudomonadota bacterium]